MYGLTEHILDGIEVDPAYYPHMAAIAFNQFGNIIFGCGGSLISTRHVLTAAHCVNDQDKTPVFVRLGTVNIEHVSEHRQDINITVRGTPTHAKHAFYSYWTLAANNRTTSEYIRIMLAPASTMTSPYWSWPRRSG